LSVVKEHNASVRHTLAEQHLLEKNKISWKDELREAIEYARDNSTNFDSFKRHLNDVYGVETKLRGKTLSFKHPEREDRKSTRLNSSHVSSSYPVSALQRNTNFSRSPR